MDDSSQVGYYLGAALWHGSPESYISLHPAGASTSSARAVRGNLQVGTISLPFNVNHAAMWRGTRESFVDLHPSGAVRSFCLATDGILQGGYVDWSSGSPHPTIWNGSAQSFVDLMWMGHTGKVNGMAPGVQVGQADFIGSQRAALWRGTPESFEDFNPPGQDSIFYATTGRIHVGVLTHNGLGRAAVNFGTPSAWLGLHQFLPSQYTGFSAANAVYQDGNTIYVGGYADYGDRQAILWIGTVPCYANCDGSTGSPRLTANDFMCFLNTFANKDPAANCDQSSGTPTLTANDFQCFINKFAAGCS